MHLINKTYTLAAPKKRVYELWLSPDTLVPPATQLEIEPHPGGIYKLTSFVNDREWVMNGKFIELIRNEKLEYTWEWNNDGEQSTVTVTFVESHGMTRVDVTHKNLPSEESKAQHEAGWDNYIQGFRAYL